MSSQNGIIGDVDPFGVEMPQTQVDDSDLAEMQKTAKFSKTAEYKELKKYLEGRMDFYTVYLPNGNPVAGHPDPGNMGAMWIAANVIVGELKAIIGVYENAAQVVKDAASRRKDA